MQKPVERKSGFYWVRWGRWETSEWEPAAYRGGSWIPLGTKVQNITPSAVGQAIPAYQPPESQRRFFCKDLTGHGGSATMNYAHITKFFDTSYKIDPEDDNVPRFEEWLREAEIGDQYTHDDEQCTFIRIEDEETASLDPTVVPAGA